MTPPARRSWRGCLTWLWSVLARLTSLIANAGFAYYEKGSEFGVLVTAGFMGIYSLPGYSLYASTKAALAPWAFAYRLENTEKHDKGLLFILFPIATRTNFFGAANSGVPVPWPTQLPEAVADDAIQGILCNQLRIFPSRLSRLALFLDRVFLGKLPAYQTVEQFKLRCWHRQRGQGS